VYTGFRHFIDLLVERNGTKPFLFLEHRPFFAESQQKEIGN